MLTFHRALQIGREMWANQLNNALQTRHQVLDAWEELHGCKHDATGRNDESILLAISMVSEIQWKKRRLLAIIAL